MLTEWMSIDYEHGIAIAMVLYVVIVMVYLVRGRCAPFCHQWGDLDFVTSRYAFLDERAYGLTEQRWYSRKCKRCESFETKVVLS